jgi:acyl-CoA thioesterase
MTSEEWIAELNRHAPGALKKLNGRIGSYDDDSGVLEMRYAIDESFCHSGDIVQGGYIAGMLDAAMAHVTFLHLGSLAIVATLEIKVSYFEIARPGQLRAKARVIKLGKSIGFFKAELFDESGTLLAAATSTSRVIRKTPAG